MDATFQHKMWVAYQGFKTSEARFGQQFNVSTGCVETMSATVWPSLSESLTTTGLNFIGGDDDDVTILCVEERGSTKP